MTIVDLRHKGKEAAVMKNAMSPACLKYCKFFSQACNPPEVLSGVPYHIAPAPANSGDTVVCALMLFSNLQTEISKTGLNKVLLWKSFP